MACRIYPQWIKPGLIKETSSAIGITPHRDFFPACVYCIYVPQRFVSLLKTEALDQARAAWHVVRDLRLAFFIDIEIFLSNKGR